MADGFEKFPEVKPEAAPAPAPAPAPAEASSWDKFKEVKPVGERRAPETYGQRQYEEDKARTEAERGVVPDEIKAFAYNAANAAALNIPSHIVAGTESLIKGTPYWDQYKAQKDYEAALARQSPTAAMAGTATGTVGSMFVPLGALGRAKTMGEAALKGAAVSGTTAGAASLIEDPGAYSKAAMDAAFGTAAGAALGPVAQKIGQYLAKKPDAFVTDKAGNLTPTPETTAAIKNAFGRDVTPEEIATFQKELVTLASQKRGVSPEVVKEAVLTAEGVPSSRQLVTGEMAPPAAKEAATSAREQAADILRQRAAGLVEPGVSPTATAEAISETARAAQKTGSRLLEEGVSEPGVFQKNFKWVEKPTPPGETPPPKPIYQREWYGIKDIVMPEIRTALQSKPGTNINFENVMGYPVSSEAFDYLRKGIASSNMPLNEPNTLRNVYAVRRELTSLYPKATGDDRRVLGAIIDGYDNFMQRAVNENLFTGDGAKALKQLEAGRGAWSKFKSDFYSDEGATASVFNNIMGKLTGPDGRLLDNLSDGAAQAAQGVVNSNILNKKMGLALYERLEKVLPPDAMTAVNANIRNMALDVGGDLSKLPKQIDAFLKPENLTVARRAFGEVAGDAASKAEATRQLAELRRLQLATETILKNPKFTPEEKTSRARELLSRYVRPAMAAMIAQPHGALPAAAAAIASEAAGRAGSGIKGASQIRAERAGAPIVRFQPEVPVRAPMSLEAPGFPESETEAGYGPPTGNVITVNPRQQRKAGGRVKTASQLMMAVEDAKRKVNNTTKPLMNMPDEHIAQALAVANKHLED